jgi:predicted alpha/beta hydrolase family esterase
MLSVQRLAGALLIAVGLGGCGSLSTFEGFFTNSPEMTGSVKQASGKAYIFRGMGGRIASFEMDRLSEKLEKSGVDAETYNHFNWSGPADEAIARYKRQNGNFPIMLVGHSAGADASVAFAQKLKDAGVPVSLIVSFDPTRRPKAVPPNVDRFINIYQSLNFFGGGFVSPGSDFHGHYASIDLKNYWEVLHVNMVKMRGLQDQIIAKMVQITTMPPQLEGATVPIHYVMPRGEKIELWDSGLPIRLDQPDTVRSIAAKYAVPAWAVAQINNLSTSETLQAGHRLIIPRHLDSLPPSAGPLTSFAPRQ